MNAKKLTRRDLLKLSAVGMAGVVLGSCHPATQAPLSPTATPSAIPPSPPPEPTASPTETDFGTLSPTDFPKEFLWGTGTSAYQIEGAWNADGKGESIWDRFTHTSGKIKNNDTADVTADHYHRYQEDVDLMQAMNLKAYRFSVSWSRVLPAGRGQANPAGLGFYDRLVDALLAAGIKPFITLYVWDLPQALQDHGGWINRDVVDAFAEFVDLTSRTLGDRVQGWATINEPYSIMHAVYDIGIHAPGFKNPHSALLASFYLMLAHGRAVSVLRANCPDTPVGIVLNPTPIYPASPSTYDRGLTRYIDGEVNRWFLDPLAGRGYPEDIIRAKNLVMDFIKPGDLDEISAPIDYLGVNYYTRYIARSTEVPEEKNLPPTVVAGNETTEMGWEVYPEGLDDILGRLHFDYHFPAYYITENGIAISDQVDENGQVHDPGRISFIERHLAQVARALHAGLPVKGYFAWSQMDNFEWAEGFAKRFGLVYIDYGTLKRTLKDSALWYRDWIASQGS